MSSKLTTSYKGLCLLLYIIEFSVKVLVSYVKLSIESSYKVQMVTLEYNVRVPRVKYFRSQIYPDRKPLPLSVTDWTTTRISWICVNHSEHIIMFTPYYFRVPE